MTDVYGDGGRASWDSPVMLPASDSKRTASYRRLQSWFRAVQLGAPAGGFRSHSQLGSWLHPDAVAAQPDLNFLHPASHLHAERRQREVQDEGGSLEPQRLFHNMLSSMPMCFNLFGAMREEPAFLLVFKQLFDPRATAITDIVCEWAPTDPGARLGDRTAFDAIVLYETADGAAFCGIETKYTEPFSHRAYEPTSSNRYREVTHESGWFATPASALESLQQSSANQLWRNTMLAARVDQHGSYGRGSLAVVALGDDPGVAKARKVVTSSLTDTHIDRLRFVSLEDILRVTEELAPALSWWATSFRRRYLDLSLPAGLSPHAGRDPLGPVVGRSIADTAKVASQSV